MLRKARFYLFLSKHVSFHSQGTAIGGLRQCGGHGRALRAALPGGGAGGRESRHCSATPLLWQPQLEQAPPTVGSPASPHTLPGWGSPPGGERGSGAPSRASPQHVPARRPRPGPGPAPSRATAAPAAAGAAPTRSPGRARGGAASSSRSRAEAERERERQRRQLRLRRGFNPGRVRGGSAAAMATGPPLRPSDWLSERHTLLATPLLLSGTEVNQSASRHGAGPQRVPVSEGAPSREAEQGMGAVPMGAGDPSGCSVRGTRDLRGPHPLSRGAGDPSACSVPWDK